MFTAMTKEEFVQILSEAAIRRFGEEEAKALNPAIQEIAASLSSIAAHEIELEEEPAFFI
jgi:hypothetical protein